MRFGAALREPDACVQPCKYSLVKTGSDMVRTLHQGTEAGTYLRVRLQRAAGVNSLTASAPGGDDAYRGATRGNPTYKGFPHHRYELAAGRWDYPSGVDTFLAPFRGYAPASHTPGYSWRTAPGFVFGNYFRQTL